MHSKQHHCIFRHPDYKHLREDICRQQPSLPIQECKRLVIFFKSNLCYIEKAMEKKKGVSGAGEESLAAGTGRHANAATWR